MYADALRDRVRRCRRRLRHDLAADDATRSTRILLMVSRFDHCLTDLLYRWRIGILGGEVAAVVSNHQDLQLAADRRGAVRAHPRHRRRQTRRRSNNCCR